MTDLRKAAQQARNALANARDYIYLLETGDVSWSEEDQLQEIRAAIISLKKALDEPDKDAERYRFLREHKSSINYSKRRGEKDFCVEVHGPRWVRRQTLNEAVDRLMGENT